MRCDVMRADRQGVESQWCVLNWTLEYLRLLFLVLYLCMLIGLGSLYSSKLGDHNPTGQEAGARALQGYKATRRRTSTKIRAGDRGCRRSQWFDDSCPVDNSFTNFENCHHLQQHHQYHAIMADAEAIAKAEKLAAAKKRVRTLMGPP